MMLRSDRSATNALERLRDRIRELEAVKETWGIGAAAVEPGKQAYLRAIENAEQAAAGFFEDDDGFTAGIYSEAYRLIRAMDTSTDRPYPLVSTEVDRQVTALNRLVAKLEGLQTLIDREGQPIILDTNVLMHYQRPDEVNWPPIIGTREAVRIVLPVLIIEELDNKKYTGSDKMAARANNAIKALRDYGKDLRPGRCAVFEGAGATLEVWLDDPNHRRKTNPDAELLDRALLLQRVLGRSVTVVSGDLGMQLRADSHGLAHAQMPNKYAKDAVRRLAAEKAGDA